MCLARSRMSESYDEISAFSIQYHIFHLDCETFDFIFVDFAES